MKNIIFAILLMPLFMGCHKKNKKQSAPTGRAVLSDAEGKLTYVNRFDSFMKYYSLNMDYRLKEDSIEILYLRTRNEKYIKEHDYYDSLKVVYGKLAGRYSKP